MEPILPSDLMHMRFEELVNPDAQVPAHEVFAWTHCLMASDGVQMKKSSPFFSWPFPAETVVWSGLDEPDELDLVSRGGKSSERFRMLGLMMPKTIAGERTSTRPKTAFRILPLSSVISATASLW